MCIYIYIYVCVYVYIYTHIYKLSSVCKELTVNAFFFFLDNTCHIIDSKQIRMPTLLFVPYIVTTHLAASVHPYRDQGIVTNVQIDKP